MVEADEATIDAPIGRDPNPAATDGGRPRWAAGGDALQRPPPFPQLHPARLALETGRTHQIRVHLAFIGHPVAGDPVYGKGSVAGLPHLDRQFLHAAELAFRLPDGREVAFESPLPDDLQAALDELVRG